MTFPLFLNSLFALLNQSIGDKSAILDYCYICFIIINFEIHALLLFPKYRPDALNYGLIFRTRLLA